MTSKDCQFDVATGVLTVPTSVNSIDYNAFRDRKDIKSVVFEEPSQVRIIYDDAFSGCVNLNSFTFPLNLGWIGARAFSGSAFNAIYMPYSVYKISVGAFSTCTKLSSINFRGGQPDARGTTIDKDAFSKCGLNDCCVYLPSSVISVDTSAFANSGLKKIELSKYADIYYSGPPVKHNLTYFEDCSATIKKY